MVFEREVAVKVLQERFGPTSGVGRRFADEAQITGHLQHPAIPPAYDISTLPDGRPFLAMKLIRGRTLDALLAERSDPTLDHGRFVAAFEQVCQAVAYAHAHKVIHRDLKPANVMVWGFGEVQVMDWGLSKVLQAGGRPIPSPILTRLPPGRDSQLSGIGRIVHTGRQRTGHARVHATRAGRRGDRKSRCAERRDRTRCHSRGHPHRQAAVRTSLRPDHPLDIEWGLQMIAVGRFGQDLLHHILATLPRNPVIVHPT